MGTQLVSLSEHDLRALRLFRNVAEAGGLTAAERQTGLERSTISRRIKALEERLGATICLRGPRGFALTDFGRDVLAAAVRLDDTLDEVKLQLSRSGDTIRGALRVGLADNCLTNPQARIMQALSTFTATAPDVDLVVQIARPAELLRALREYRLDCCIVGASPGDGTLKADPLFEEEFRLFVRSNGNTAPTLAALAQHSFGLVERIEEMTPFPLALRRIGLRTVRAEGLEAVATLLATGRFAGQLPTHYAEALRTSIPLVEVREARETWIRVRFSFVSLRSRPPSRAQEHLRQLMVVEHDQQAKSA
jgi:DNA-binding transcriptional LysR family regulator